MNKIRGLKETQKTITTSQGPVTIFHLPSMTSLGLPDPGRLPFSIKILLENVLRHFDGQRITMDDVRDIAQNRPGKTTLFFYPSRVLLQDFTGVPCLVDLAAMRDAIKRLGGSLEKINPLIPCHLVIDHSVQVDASGSREALDINVRREFQRNRERYRFLKWGRQAFKNLSIVPPATGIIHQVNLEYLAQGVLKHHQGKQVFVFPDSLIGTDSHTPMINSLGIAGWGVGGIEAEAVLLGEPVAMLVPEVVGVQLTGQMPDFATATDCVLTLTELLRRKGVVAKFVEYFGEGLSSLSMPDRAVIANMTPEYGATMGLFPVDQETLNYYQLTGRSAATIDLIERTMKEQGMFYDPDGPRPEYADVVTFDLSSVKTSLAGPRRPQDRVLIGDLKRSFGEHLKRPAGQNGAGLNEDALRAAATLSDGTVLRHGSVVIAALTSCTNTSNPQLMIGAGLMARKAVDAGLSVPSFVKTSFAPGSQVVDGYLRDSGLLSALEKLGFHIVGFGCMTCIGNSGPLAPPVARAITENNLTVASVLSGNRNFEGRIHPLVKANYLASPLLVVAYALAGTVMIDLDNEPIGKNPAGRDVYLKDIWPSIDEINEVMFRFLNVKTFKERYKNVLAGSREWKEVKAPKAALYAWDPTSTYIQSPPFFNGIEKRIPPLGPVRGARVLVMTGDSVTTDHISPAGSIPGDTPAGRYLSGLGIAPGDFNSYGSRRGNDRVMTRGTFANVRIKNLLVPGSEGSWTIFFPTGQRTDIYAAARMYREKGIPLMVLAGKEYGTGSSRDWAAKGPALLGVRIVLAENFERIHRSNLVGMGILPLEFLPGETAATLGLSGDEIFDFTGLDDTMTPAAAIEVTAAAEGRETKRFKVCCRLDTSVEVAYYRHGGILPYVLRKTISPSGKS